MQTVLRKREGSRSVSIPNRLDPEHLKKTSYSIHSRVFSLLVLPGGHLAECDMAAEGELHQVPGLGHSLQLPLVPVLPSGHLAECDMAAEGELHQVP